MAIRLPVVLSQHAKRVATYTDCEESWITSLLFEERLDATLVADLSFIQLDSTDYLCLAGIKGDFVLVSWEDSSVVCRELVRLGFDSFDLVPVDGSAKISSPQRDQNVKRIYLMGFQRGVSVSKPIEQLKGLLESKSTPVFQLQMNSKDDASRGSLSPPVVSGNSPSALSPIRTVVGNPRSASSKVSGGDTHTQMLSDSPEIVHDAVANRKESLHSPSSTALPSESNFAYEDDQEFPHIDSLVDELDRFDS